MTRLKDEATSRLRPASTIGRLPTGAKLMLLLSAALLPLAIIAFFATLQTTRTADQESQARLRVAAAESSRALAIELLGDATALRAALNVLDADRGNAPVCARAQGVFAQQSSTGAQFMIADRAGGVLCGSRFPPGLARMPDRSPGLLAAQVLPERGIVLSMGGTSGSTFAAAYFPTSFLARIGRPTGFAIPYALTLTKGDDRLPLNELGGLEGMQRRRVQSNALGLDDLTLEIGVARTPLTSPVLLAMLLPIVMWAAAAAIGWFVVDRLLIRPLRDLRANAAGYVPGEIIELGEVRQLPAQEIRELGETFRAISRTVALHEADLAAGLIRQTRLTREVHHRVKNNLQVIASLINFHSRGAQGAEALAAYASIQRRVDALAVVHRNHHAEMEDTRGLPLRGMIGELASNIRATAPPTSARLGITIDIAPYLVSQDVAVAIAFLTTEVIELAMASNPEPQIRISARDGNGDGQAILRISSPALSGDTSTREGVAERYGRVMTGLARQLRATLHHDPLVGAYEIAVSVTGRE